MICVGVVLIPTQTSALYAQLTARRRTIGPLPLRGEPFVLVSARLSDVRGFSDFLLEFFAAARRAGLPRNTRMVVLGGRSATPFEFSALQVGREGEEGRWWRYRARARTPPPHSALLSSLSQELNDRRLTIVEGSALSDRDLTRLRAESAAAVLLLADRFSPAADQEDLNVLFQCWAVKSYVKRVPVYVQLLKRASLASVRPFLDPERDVAVSVEQTRHRLLALSALCPGACTLLANLLRRSSISPVAAARPRAGGRRWLRAYMNGCAHALWVAPLSPTYAGVPFAVAAEAVHRAGGGAALVGVLRGGRAVLNPGRRRLRGDEAAILVAPDQAAANAAAGGPYRALDAERAEAALRGGGGARAVPPPPAPCAPPDALESESVDFEADVDVAECPVPDDGADSGDEGDDAPPLATADASRLPPTAAAAVAGGRSAAADDAAGGPGWVDDASYFAGDELGGGASGGAAAAAAVAAAAAAGPRPPPVDASPSPSPPLLDAAGDPLAGHVIVAGAPASVLPFVAQLRACDPVATPVVVLAPRLPSDWDALRALGGPLHHVAGEASSGAGLRAARAASARALVFLALPARPDAIPAPLPSGDRADASRTAVLADAPGLLASYGVGEEGGGAAPPHAVVELCFTSSLRFLQPGLLLKGVATDFGGARSLGPRASWQARRAQEDAAMAEGLAAWQANPYVCAGRVLVPAIMDTFACHSFLGARAGGGGRGERGGDPATPTPSPDDADRSRAVLADVLAELAGDDGRPGGAALRQVPVPADAVGGSYGDLVARLALRRNLVALGLWRKKSENATWRLSYVVTCPPRRTVVESGDRVFVLRERGGAWLTDEWR
jgi:hypothetical protein